MIKCTLIKKACVCMCVCVARLVKLNALIDGSWRYRSSPL